MLLMLKHKQSTAILYFIFCFGIGSKSNHVVAQLGKPSSIVGFEPLTDVRDQNRIDLDQNAIEELLAVGDFSSAQKIYQVGSHSKSVSLLSVAGLAGLADPTTDRATGAGIPVDIEQGVFLTGSNSAGDPVSVFAQGKSYKAGDTSFSIQYLDEGCYVGPNPNPVTEGCLAPIGTLSVNDSGDEGANITSFTYEYDPLTSSNVYNIQRFTGVGEFRFAPGDPLTRDFQKFVDFYGSESFADDIITAGFEGTSTDFPTGKNVDVSNYGELGRAQIAKKGAAYMAVSMYVIRELEHAIYLCETGDCGEESCLGKAAVHEVDEAVAFYAGSLEGLDGSGEGVLLYNLADKRAAEFKTAGRNGDSLSGTAKVNHDLLEFLESSSAHIVSANCQGVRADTTRIVQAMTIPMIQGTLRYAYLTAEGIKTDEEADAERAIFAASVLPFVAACNAVDADTIYENTMTGATTVDFLAIKTAFENNYDCMGITGAEVGGLWNPLTESYYEGAEPAGVSDGSATSSTAATGLQASIVLGVISVINHMI